MFARRKREDVIGTTVASRYAVAAFQRAGRFGDVYCATRTGDDAPVFIQPFNRGSLLEKNPDARPQRSIDVANLLRTGPTP